MEEDTIYLSVTFNKIGREKAYQLLETIMCETTSESLDGMHIYIANPIMEEDIQG